MNLKNASVAGDGRFDNFTSYKLVKVMPLKSKQNF